MNFLELEAWAAEARPDLDEIVAGQDRPKGPRFDPPATLDVHPGADPRRYALSGESSSSRDFIEPLPSGRPYNRFIDRSVDDLLEEACADIARVERARTPLGAVKAELKRRDFINGLREIGSLHKAVLWRAIELLVEDAQGRYGPRASEDERAAVVMRYTELKAAGYTAREVYRQIKAETGVSRSTAQRWVAHFANEQPKPLLVEGENEMTKEEVLEAIREEGERTRAEPREHFNDVFRALAAFRETPEDAWRRHVEVRVHP